MSIFLEVEYSMTWQDNNSPVGAELSFSIEGRTFEKIDKLAWEKYYNEIRETEQMLHTKITAELHVIDAFQISRSRSHHKIGGKSIGCERIPLQNLPQFIMVNMIPKGLAN